MCSVASFHGAPNTRRQCHQPGSTEDRGKNTWMFTRSEPANFSTFVRLTSDKLLYNVNVMSHFVRLSIVDCDACVVGDDANHVEQVLDPKGKDGKGHALPKRGGKEGHAQPKRDEGAGCFLPKHSKMSKIEDFQIFQSTHTDQAKSSPRKTRLSIPTANCQAGTEAQTSANMPLPGATSLLLSEGPGLPQTLARVLLLLLLLPCMSGKLDRARHKVARIALNFQPQPSWLAAQRRQRDATLGLAVGFRGSPFSGGPPYPASTGFPDSRDTAYGSPTCCNPLHLTRTTTPLW